MCKRIIKMESRHPGIRGKGFFINHVPVNDREHAQFCRALRRSGRKLVQVELHHKGKCILAPGFWAGEYDKNIEPDPRLLQRLRRWWKRPGVRDRCLIIHMDRTVEWFKEHGYM